MNRKWCELHLVSVDEDALQTARYISTTYTTAAIAARTHSVSCAASVSAECQVNPTDRPLQCNGSWAYPRLAVNVHTVALQQVVPVPVHPDFWMPRMLLPHLQLARSLGIGAALGFDSTQQPRLSRLLDFCAQELGHLPASAQIPHPRSMLW